VDAAHFSEVDLVDDCLALHDPHGGRLRSRITSTNRV
jgi:hypothetical protein